jgi:hypothetical protein
VTDGIEFGIPKLRGDRHSTRRFAQQMQNMPRDQLRQLLSAFTGAAAGGGGMGGGGGGRGMGGGGDNVVHLTREESEAVGRLAELGFSRDDCVQAFLACDKNESLAANLLFDGFESTVRFWKRRGEASSLKIALERSSEFAVFDAVLTLLPA